MPPVRRAALGALAASLLLGASAGRVFELTADDAARMKLSYYSDYFSFAGADGAGRVLFALDNNRGRDGDAFQAEHFACLYDEKSGWVPVRGSGPYPNSARLLGRIPDSPDFSFEGDAASGIAIRSASNGLSLEVRPVAGALARKRGEASYWLGSAAAVLHWRGRTIPGRVIYEYLYLPGWNRLTRKYPGEWKGFNGLYLAVEGGGDVYLHRADGETPLTPLTGLSAGFAVLASTSPLDEPRFAPVARRAAPGFYRWPTRWTGRFEQAGAPYEFTLETIDGKTFSNWIIGGFRMAAVRGRLRGGGREKNVFGFAELLI